MGKINSTPKLPYWSMVGSFLHAGIVLCRPQELPQGYRMEGGLVGYGIFELDASGNQ